jgi:hypothetical protein
MQVRIITYCPDASALCGNLLIFRSLRVGFPTARILVADNRSSPWARLRRSKNFHQRCSWNRCYSGGVLVRAHNYVRTVGRKLSKNLYKYFI